jgi:hypothetical protein
MRRLLAVAVIAELSLLVAARASAQEAVPAPAPATAPVTASVTGTAPSTDTVVVQTPPPEAAPAAPAASTVVVEDKKDTTRMLEDGGLGLEWVYLNADLGAAYTDLVSLKSSNWAIQDSSSAGPAFGIGAGIRLIFLSLGLRARDLQLSSFNLWEVDAEAALHFRIWRIDGSIGARGGYAFLGKFSADSLETSTGSSASNVTVHGWNVGPTFDLDVYITKHISVGIDANAEVLFLKRPALPLQPGQTIPQQFQPLYADSGSSVGAGFVGMTHLGVHF